MKPSFGNSPDTLKIVNSLTFVVRAYLDRIMIHLPDRLPSLHTFCSNFKRHFQITIF